jgi:hypothetical protein
MSDDTVESTRAMHLAYRARVGQFVLNRIEEVQNHIGGVIGYRLNLSAEETEKLMKIIES